MKRGSDGSFEGVEGTQTESNLLVSSLGQPGIDIALMERQAVRWGKVKRSVLLASRVCFLASFVSFAIWYLVRLQPEFDSLFLLAISFLSLVAGFAVRIIGVVIHPMRRNPLQQVWETSDPRSIGTLLEATEMLVPGFRNKSVESLIDLLPQITAEHAAKLTPFQRKCLIGLIGVGLSERPDWEGATVAGGLFTESRQLLYNQVDRRTEVAVRILEIVGRCGSSKDLEVVSRIAEGQGLANSDMQVRDAAVNCVTVITERLKNNTYLRPAQPPGGDAELLLRPVDGSKLPVDQLLRPSDSSK